MRITAGPLGFMLSGWLVGRRIFLVLSGVFGLGRSIVDYLTVHRGLVGVIFVFGLGHGCTTDVRLSTT